MASKRKSTTSAARIAARVRKAQAGMRAAAKRYNDAAAAAANPGPMFGPFIPQELLARRRADSVLARALRKKRGSKKKRSTKRKVSAAQRAARARFAAAAKARSKAGKRRKSSSVKAKPSKRPTAKRRSTKRKGAQRTVTANQIIAMAKKGALQNWLCRGVRRTGCGGAGKVVSGKGRFSRLR